MAKKKSPESGKAASAVTEDGMLNLLQRGQELVQLETFLSSVGLTSVDDIIKASSDPIEKIVYLSKKVTAIQKRHFVAGQPLNKQNPTFKDAYRTGQRLRRVMYLLQLNNEATTNHLEAVGLAIDVGIALQRMQIRWAEPKVKAEATRIATLHSAKADKARERTVQFRNAMVAAKRDVPSLSFNRKSNQKMRSEVAKRMPFYQRKPDVKINDATKEKLGQPAWAKYWDRLTEHDRSIVNK